MKLLLTRAVEWLVSRFHLRLHAHTELEKERSRHARTEETLASAVAELKGSRFQASLLEKELEVVRQDKARFQEEMFREAGRSRQALTEMEASHKTALNTVAAERETSRRQIEELQVEKERIRGSHASLQQESVQMAQEMVLLRATSIPSPSSIKSLLPDAARACRDIESSSARGTSGEWKRHRALDRLVQLHPKASQRDIALAIETVLWRNL